MEINATPCFVLSVLEKVCITQEKKNIEATPLTHKAKDNISSKVSRNMDANYCFSDTEATLKAILFKKHDIVEMNQFCSALETNLV